MKPRQYQLDFVKNCFNLNFICVAPTGSGKTHIACMIVDQLLHGNSEYLGDDYFHSEHCSCKEGDTYSPKKIIYIVPSTSLKKQQSDKFKLYFYSRQCRRLKCKNSNTINTSKGWNFVVATPTSLLNALSIGIISMHDIQLLIFDEAHHTNGNHAYNIIMKKYYFPLQISNQSSLHHFNSNITPKSGDLPKIVGLTATPLSFSLTKKFSHKGVLLSKLSQLEENLDAKLRQVNLQEDNNKSMVYMLKYRNDYKDNYWSNLLNFTSSFDIEVDMSIHYSSLGILGSLLILGELLEMDGDEILKEFNNKYNYDINYDRLLESDFITDKLKLLIQLVVNYNTINANYVRSIVFTQRRLHARVLFLIMSKIDSINLVGLNYIVGKSGLSKQKVAAIDFNPSHRIIVATNVVEEGVDIPNCSLVINFDSCATSKHFQQSVGRARHEQSICILFNNSDEYKEQLIEKRLYSSVDVVFDVNNIIEAFKENIVTHFHSEQVTTIQQDDHDNQDDEDVSKLSRYYVPKCIQFQNIVFDNNNQIELHLSVITTNYTGRDIHLNFLSFGQVENSIIIQRNNSYLKVEPHGFIKLNPIQLEKLTEYHISICNVTGRVKTNDYNVNDGRFYLLSPRGVENSEDNFDWESIDLLLESLKDTNNNFVYQETKIHNSIDTNKLIITKNNGYFFIPCYLDDLYMTDTFLKDGTTPCTFKEHYEKKKITITDTNQKLIDVFSIQNDAFSKVVPELCSYIDIDVEQVQMYHQLISYLLPELEKEFLLEELKVELNDLPYKPTCLSRALTHRSYNEYLNYERMETYGDLILKHLVTLDVILADPHASVNEMVELKKSKICNDHLIDVSIKFGFDRFIIDNRFINFRMAGTKSKLQSHRLHNKPKGDVIESMIAAFGYNDHNDSIPFLNKLDLIGRQCFDIKDFIFITPGLSKKELKNKIIEKIPLIEEHVRIVENIIGYKFKEELYIYYALIHNSYSIPGVNYQVLELFGDSVLDLYIGVMLFKNFTNMDPGTMHNCKIALAGNALMEDICIRHGIDKLFFTKSQSKLDRDKAKADVIEAIIGAIALDSNLNWNTIYDFFETSIFSEELYKWLEYCTKLDNEMINVKNEEIQHNVELVSNTVKIRTRKQSTKYQIDIINISNFNNNSLFIEYLQNTFNIDIDNSEFFYLVNNEWIGIDHNLLTNKFKDCKIKLIIS